MIFQAKLFKLGNSRAVYIPKNVHKVLEMGKVYTFEILKEGTKSNREELPRIVSEPPHQKWVFNIKKGVDELITVP